jgi:hypothetical protein
MIPVTDPETGYTHRSMQSFCYAAGLAPNTLAIRRHRGYPPPELLTFPGNLQKIPSRDHEGRDFESLAAMCRYWKVNPTTFTLRLQRGWSVKKSLTAAFVRSGRRSKPIDITIDGQHFSTLKELSQHLNISSDILGLRIKRGWPSEKLKLMPEKRCRRKGMSHD